MPVKTGPISPGGILTTFSTTDETLLYGRTMDVDSMNSTVTVETIFGLSGANVVIPVGIKIVGTSGGAPVASGASSFISMSMSSVVVPP